MLDFLRTGDTVVFTDLTRFMEKFKQNLKMTSLLFNFR